MTSMTWNACLDGLVLTGRMSKDQAKEASDLVERLQSQYAETMTMSAAERAAAERAAQVLAEKKVLAKRQKALQALRTQENVQDILSHDKGAVAGALAKLTKDMWGKADWSNVEFRMNHWQGLLHGRMSTALEAYRSKYAGLKQDRVGIRKFIRELYGESTGDRTASAGAKAWADTTELARQAANNAGGDIKKRSDWFLTNHHDQHRILKAGQVEWLRMVKGLNVEIRDPDPINNSTNY